MSKKRLYTVSGIPDDEFLTKEKVPMTKRSVRSLIMSYLMPFPGAVVYDIGAGSGSVAVECALAGCTVYAIERNPMALELIADNSRHFGVDINILKGEAPDALFSLPPPQRIFLGGSGGKMADILETCNEKLENGGRIVLTSVTLGNGSTPYHYLEEKGYCMDAIQIQVSKVKGVGSSRIWQGENPVTIISGEKRDGK